MPYVQTGLIKDLYMSSFVLILVNLLLLINVLRRRKREFKFIRLDLIWWVGPKDLNSMINHCIRKIIQSVDGIPA